MPYMGIVLQVRARLDERSCVVALHACTEANAASIELAREVGALWAVMPCCMRSDACLPAGCQLLRCPDDIRHALLCGSLAERCRVRVAGVTGVTDVTGV